ncbi:MAG: hypothetical protein AABY93_07360 [Bacteroidota bacterium]
MIINIFHTELVNCELDDSIPVLKHRWLKEPTGEQFENGLIEIARLYRDIRKSYKNLAWLADTEMLGELSAEVEKWLQNTWEEVIFKESGVTIHAVILGASIFADYPMEKFKMDAEEKFKSHHVNLGVFSDQKSAYEWIKRLI